jgi:streptogramin lyase
LDLLIVPFGRYGGNRLAPRIVVRVECRQSSRSISMVARWLGRALLTFLIAIVVAGCGGHGTSDGRNGERGTTATNEETTASVRGPADLNVEMAPSGGAYMPAGFGEGSLWAIDIATCNDSASPGSSASAVKGSAPVTLVACALSNRTLLKRLDPDTGEEVATVPLEKFPTNTTEVVVGAGSVWVSSTSGEAGVVIRVDPETNRVMDSIPVPADSPTNLAFGHGSVWITSAGHDTVSRVDPQTGEVEAKIEVGEGVVDIATDETSGDVWVAGAYQAGAKKLSRVDPETNRVVAEIPIDEQSRYGGAQSVAVGEGAMWAQSADSGKLFKVDPASNEVVGVVTLGDYSSDLAVYGGSVWATVQASSRTRLVRLDPRTAHVVGSAYLGPTHKVGFGLLVAGGGYVWFVSGADKTALARVAP